MKKILVIGDIDTDIFLRVPKIPSWDEGILAEKSEMKPGGKGANTAVQLYSLGAEVSLCACIGDDMHRQTSLDRISKLHMDRRYIVCEEDQPTTYCIMLLDDTGEKALVVAPSPHIYPPESVLLQCREAFAESDHVHIIGLQPEKMLPVLPLLEEYGCSLSVDLDSAVRGMEASKPLIRASEILFVNSQGLGNLFPGIGGEDAVRHLAGMGPSVVVGTMGSKGSVCFDGDRISRADACRIDPEDTTGSGDACIAAFLHGYFSKGESMERLLEYSNSAGALVAMEVGGQSVLLNDEMIRDFQKQNYRELPMNDATTQSTRETIHFYEPFDEYGYFCNLSEHPVLIDGTEWPTAEHYYQAQKHNDAEYKERIRQCEDPQEAIALGRDTSLPSFSEKEWMGIRIDVMREVVLCKFRQHEELKKLLLATGDAYLAEHTEKDFFWGDGLNGMGKNWLGKILMETRAMLKQES